MVSATMSEKDLLSYLLSISSGVTPDTLMDAVSRLPAGSNTNKIGALSVGACMNIRNVINDIRAKAGVTLTPEWKINEDINFSMMAMLGHALFILPTESLTVYGQAAKASYVASIGGVANITMFTESSRIEGKEERSKILLKWSGQLSGFKVTKYQSLLAEKFPLLVVDERGMLSKAASGVAGILFYPIKAVYNVTAWVIKTLWSAFRYPIYALLFYTVIAFIAKAAAPGFTAAFSNLVTGSNDKEEVMSVAEAAISSVGAIPAISLRAATQAGSILAVSPRLLLSSAALGWASAVAAGSEIRKAYDTGGESLQELVSAETLSSVSSSLKERGLAGLNWVLSGLVYIATGETVDLGVEYIDKDAYSELAEAFMEDMSAFVGSAESEGVGVFDTEAVEEAAAEPHSMEEGVATEEEMEL